MQLPEKLGGSGVAATRAWEGLDHYAPNRHDTGSTTARSVDEVALIRDTISHYAPVLIASLSIPNRRTGDQKKFEAHWRAQLKLSTHQSRARRGTRTGPPLRARADYCWRAAYACRSKFPICLEDRCGDRASPRSRPRSWCIRA